MLPAPLTGPSAPGPVAAPGILHVDMDAFFVAVEVLADPSLAGRAVIVGGVGARGVVASCSYEARAYGVRSAMPSALARRLCPEAVWLPGRHGAYARMSEQLHEVLGSFTPLVEGVSLDEAFLDVSGAARLLGPAPEIAHVIRQAVTDILHLDCSVGVARCKLLAKLASKAAKPRASMLAGPHGARPSVSVRPGAGVVVIEPGAELDFLHPLSVGALWGVGPATAARLARLGVETVGQLAAVPPEVLVATFGQALGRQLHDMSWARDDRRVQPGREVKSVGHEETYAQDHTDVEVLHRQVVRMSDAVAARLRGLSRAGRTVTLKVRFVDFSTITRSRSHPVALADGPGIARVASELLAALDLSAGVRLLGVSVSGLCQPGVAGDERQLSLVASRPDGRPAEPDGRPPERQTAPGWVAASAAMDAVRERFGVAALGPAVLAGGAAGLDVKRVGDTQWGPSQTV